MGIQLAHHVTSLGSKTVHTYTVVLCLASLCLLTPICFCVTALLLVFGPRFRFVAPPPPSDDVRAGRVQFYVGIAGLHAWGRTGQPRPVGQPQRLMG